MNNKLCRKQNESTSQQTSSPTPPTASKDKDKAKRSGSPTITTQISQDTHDINIKKRRSR